MKARPISDVAFTPAVKAAQEVRGSRDSYARMEQTRGWNAEVDDNLAAFLAERDSFYLGTANADGQPYIQHRGGSPGFLRVLDAKTLAFPDYPGNRQYISVGNLSENDRAFLFLMDYPNRRRIKIWGRAEVVEGNAELTALVADPDEKTPAQRIFRFHIEAWDANCPKFIRPRYTEEQIAPVVDRLQQRIRELEAEVDVLRGARSTTP